MQHGRRFSHIEAKERKKERKKKKKKKKKKKRKRERKKKHVSDAGPSHLAHAPATTR